MLPAYFTALGTQSSAATIPVTLEQTKKNGVSAEVAGFVIPLCATIHLSGQHTENRSLRTGIDDDAGIPFDFPLFAGFIFMLGITMIAAPGFRAELSWPLWEFCNPCSASTNRHRL